MNITAPEQSQASYKKKKRSVWSFLKPVLLLMVCACVSAYVAFFYVVPKHVNGIRLVPKPIVLEIAGPALLDARNKVTITARIQGFLKAINIDRNDYVKTGDVLAELESADLANQLVAAQADAKAADNAIAEARSEQQRANAIAEKAKQDFNRKLALRDRQVISEADWSATQGAYHQTQAELLRSEATILKATAQSASAEANVKLLKVRLDYATITSPLTGVVVSRDRNVGDLLSPGTPLVQLVDPDSIILSARLDESVMGLIGPGQPVSAQFASTPLEPISGRVLRLVRLVDQETREFAVDITLDHLPKHWALGQRANIVVKAQTEGAAFAIPQKFVSSQSGRVGVWRLKGGVAEWTKVDLGYPSGDDIQVLKGVQPGDVVLDPAGAYSLMRVSPVEPGQ